MLFYEFEVNGNHVRVPAHAALVTKTYASAGGSDVYNVCVIGGPQHIGYTVKEPPRLVDLLGGGVAPLGLHPMLLVDSRGVRPVTEGGSPDSKCQGAHVPLDENDCPLPTCSECGAYHQVVRPGKTQPTCLCDAFRFECEKNKDLEERVEAQSKMLARLHEAAAERQRIVDAYLESEPDVNHFDLDESDCLSLTETSGFEADLDKHDKCFLKDLANLALREHADG